MSRLLHWARRRGPRGWRPAMLLAAVLLAAGVGCAEWSVTNPYDPRFVIAIRIVSSDTVRNYGDSLVFRLETEPAWQKDWPPMVVTWTAIDAYTYPIGADRLALQTSGDGRVAVRPGRNIGGNFLIRAKFRGLETIKSPVVLIDPVTTRGTLCGIGAVPGRPSPVIQTRQSVRLCLEYLDRDGELIPRVLGAVTNISARDTSVIGVARTEVVDGLDGPYSDLIPRADGATWVDLVTTLRDGRTLRDSFAVTVRLPR